jgi:hypothetical protein
MPFEEAIELFEILSCMIFSKIISREFLFSWTHDAICRTLQLLQSRIPHGWPNHAHCQFEIMLQSTLGHTNTNVICFDSKEVWVTPFAGRRFDCLQVQAIVNSPEITATFPRQTLTESGYPVVCWKYEREAGSFIISDKKDGTSQDIMPTHCC